MPPYQKYLLSRVLKELEQHNYEAIAELIQEILDIENNNSEQHL